MPTPSDEQAAIVAKLIAGVSKELQGEALPASASENREQRQLELEAQKAVAKERRNYRWSIGGAIGIAELDEIIDLITKVVELYPGQ